MSVSFHSVPNMTRRKGNKGLLECCARLSRALLELVARLVRRRVLAHGCELGVYGGRPHQSNHTSAHHTQEAFDSRETHTRGRSRQRQTTAAGTACQRPPHPCAFVAQSSEKCGRQRYYSIQKIADMLTSKALLATLAASKSPDRPSSQYEAVSGTHHELPTDLF